jgi:GST-like protein
MGKLILYGEPGWGSAIVEAQLVWLDLPFDYVKTGDLLGSEEARRALERVNPLAQVPTLVLADGRVLTESAAITLYLSDLTGRDDLVPPPQAPERAEFLRWLIYLVANIYPTFTYADVPARFVEVEAAQKPFRTALDRYGERLWRNVEAAAKGPWFLGARFSALDLYLAVMTRWRPKRPWFAEHAPKLHAAAEAADATPRLKEVWARNFGKP